MRRFNDVAVTLPDYDRAPVLWTPEATLYHLESKTRGYEDDPVKQERFRREFDLFRRKWQRELEAGDPYYNPNLRLDRADCALRA